MEKRRVRDDTPPVRIAKGIGGLAATR